MTTATHDFAGDCGSADRVAIAAVLERYDAGLRRADVGILRSVFHETAHMYGRVGRADVCVPIEQFFNNVATTDPIWNQEGRHKSVICHLIVAGDIATAHVREEQYLGRDFDDLFTLFRIRGEWKIVCKAFRRIREPG